MDQIEVAKPRRGSARATFCTRQVEPGGRQGCAKSLAASSLLGGETEISTGKDRIFNHSAGLAVDSQYSVRRSKAGETSSCIRCAPTSHAALVVAVGLPRTPHLVTPTSKAGRWTH
jgi:hypothetical protein